MFIDTHCHIHDSKAFPDINVPIEAAKVAGVNTMILVGVDPADWDLATKTAEKHEELFAIVGWHPNHSAEFTEDSMRVLREHLAHPKVLALGEIGLDYHWDYSPRAKQHEVLIAGLDLAQELGKPVVFHAREAYSDLLDVLETRPPANYLFHCWAGDTAEAERAVKLGACFGVDGPVTYPKAEALRECLRTIPMDRLVLETDAPYMAPHPFRGKPNQPAYLPYIAEGLAKCLDISIEECAEITTTNAKRFFWGR